MSCVAVAAHGGPLLEGMFGDAEAGGRFDAAAEIAAMMRGVVTRGAGSRRRGASAAFEVWA